MADISWLASTLAKASVAPLQGNEILRLIDDPSGSPLSGSATIDNIIERMRSLGNTFTATQTITPAANTSAVVVSGASLTGANAQSFANVSGTWNTSGTPTAVKLNITDTASNADSLLMDLQKSGVSTFAVRKDGSIVGYQSATDNYTLALGSSKTALTGARTVELAAGSGWNVSVVATGGMLLSLGGGSVYMYTDAANTLAQRSGTNAQTFRLYNTYTDAANYERGFMRWASNFLQIGAEAAGTGTARALKVISGTNSIWLEGAVGQGGQIYVASGNGGAENNVAWLRFRQNGSDRGYVGYTTSGGGVFGLFNSSAAPMIRFDDSTGVATVAANTATPAGGSTSARLLMGTTAQFGIYYGSGAPSVSAAQGSIYIRSDGSSTSTRLYVNTDGTTGWTNFTSAT